MQVGVDIFILYLIFFWYLWGSLNETYLIRPENYKQTSLACLDC